MSQQQTGMSNWAQQPETTTEYMLKMKKHRKSIVYKVKTQFNNHIIKLPKFPFQHS